MKIYPKLDWISHPDTVITGPGPAYEPARMPASNIGTRVLNENSRILSNTNARTYWDIDFGQSRPVDGVAMIGLNAGNLSDVLPARARVIASDVGVIVEDYAPTSVALINCTGVVGDIDDDPDADEGDWLVYSGAGQMSCKATFPVSTGDLIAQFESGEVRILVASSDGATHNFEVELKSSTSFPAETITGLSVTNTVAQGGEVVSVDLATAPWFGHAVGNLEITIRSDETSGAAAVVGAMHVYVASNVDHDSGWIDIFPSGLESEADVLKFSANWYHVFDSVITTQRLRLWIDNQGPEYIDVATAVAGEALDLWKGFALQGTSYGTESSATVETSESGQPFITEGISRDLNRFALPFMTREEVHEFRMFFDRVKGTGREFVLIPDETDPTTYFNEAIYGRMTSLKPASMAHWYRDDVGVAKVAFARELEMIEVGID